MNKKHSRILWAKNKMANCKLSVWWSFICIIELYMIWAYCMYNRNVLILQQVRNPTPAAALTYQVCLWVCSFWVLLQTSSATTPTRKHWTLHQNYFKLILWDNPVFHQKPVLPFHIKTYFKFIFWNSTVFHQAHIFFLLLQHLSALHWGTGEVLYGHPCGKCALNGWNA